ncbi:hypothetical protein HMPREF0083_03534 [Aneurinibacillus aneurinilyticus ATCC 12856]|uniref:Uncharacterized protein n=1 Tax=Aneurinibacillus aneurinilyticus ATCC 12856 TaxID=649747 RepID=U1WIJ0_ANEAE|nr:hypothetical protein HMPREF0083_03534 [Aneurinibacillus aneurinilyticus ATCC 12856]
MEGRRCTRRRVPSSFSTRKRHGRFVAPGPDRQNIWASRCGRRTDARLGHGVMTLHSGLYWIINTLEEKTLHYQKSTYKRFNFIITVKLCFKPTTGNKIGYR